MYGPAQHFSHRQTKTAHFTAGRLGTHGRIRTLNLLIRSQILYPIELRAPINLSNSASNGGEDGIRTHERLLHR